MPKVGRKKCEVKVKEIELNEENFELKLKNPHAKTEKYSNLHKL